MQSETLKVHLTANYGGRFMLHKIAGNQFKMSYDPELNTHLELDLDTSFY